MAAKSAFIGVAVDRGGKAPGGRLAAFRLPNGVEEAVMFAVDVANDCEGGSSGFVRKAGASSGEDGGDGGDSRGAS